MSFNFMAVVTICSDFGAQENKVCHSFYCFPIYLPWAMGVEAVIIVFCHDLRSINAMILAVSSQWLILLLIYCFCKEKLWDLLLLYTVPILWSQGAKVRSLSFAGCAWYSLPDSPSILSHHLHYPRRLTSMNYTMDFWSPLMYGWF